jgi:hypothetical protein
VQEVARSVRNKSDGNFLYVSQLLQMLHTRPAPITSDAINELPDGLLDFYRKFLRQLFGQNISAWNQQYVPVLGSLAVAQEAVSSTDLAGFAGLKKSQVRQIISEVGQLLDYQHDVRESQRSYSFFHRSFAEFLLDEDAADRFCAILPSNINELPSTI